MNYIGDTVNIAGPGMQDFHCGILSEKDCEETCASAALTSVYTGGPGCQLGQGDTMLFRGHSYSSPKHIVGRIITIHQHPPPDNLIQHPHASQDTSYFNLRLFLSQDNHSVLHQAQIPRSTPETLHLPELIQTNLCILISSSLARKTALVLHLNDCINQKFGPVDGRADVYYVINEVCFPLPLAPPRYLPLNRSIYNPFGPCTGTFSHHTCVTERRARVVQSINSSVSAAMALRGSDIPRNRRCQIHLGRDSWQYVVYCLDITADVLEITRALAPVRVPRSDLSLLLGTEVSKTDTIVIETRPQFSSLKQLFGRNFGVQILKKTPPMANLEVAYLNPSVLVPTDEINYVELALDPIPEDDDEAPASAAPRSFVKFVYSHTRGTLTIIVRCQRSVVSLLADRITPFVDQQDWAVFKLIDIGHRVELDNLEWSVVHVNSRLEQVTIRCVEGGHGREGEVRYEPLGIILS